MEDLKTLTEKAQGSFCGRFGSNPMSFKCAELSVEMQINMAVAILEDLSKLQDGYECEQERFADVYGKIIRYQEHFEKLKTK